jgi:O-antigen/teichoic acid export membrane protein
MKTQILNLGKDSLIYGVGSVITRFIGLLMLPLFTAYLTPEEYGVLAMLALLSMVVQPIFGLGLGAAMGPCYFESDDAQNKSTVIWTTFLIHILSSALLVIVGFAFPSHIAELVGLSSEQDQLITLSLTSCAFSILTTSIATRLQFERQAKHYVAVTLITAVTTIFVSVITIVILGWGVRGMVIGHLFGNLITLLTLTYIVLRTTKIFVSKIIAKELIRNGFPLIPSFVFIFILMHANKFIIEWKLGLDAVGLYSIGFNIGMTISIITGGISVAWYPFFLKFMNRQSEVNEIFSKIFSYYIIGVGLLCLFYFLFAKSIVELLTQQDYHSTYHLVGFIAIANFSQTLFVFFLPGLYFNKEVKYVSLIQGFAALLSIPLNYYFIIEFGVVGAAVGLALSNTLMAIFLYIWNVINKSRYPYVNYEWPRIFRFLIMLLFICIMNECISANGIAYEVAKSISITTLAIILTFYLLTKNEKYFLLNLLKFKGVVKK